MRARTWTANDLINPSHADESEATAYIYAEAARQRESRERQMLASNTRFCKNSCEIRTYRSTRCGRKDLPVFEQE